MNQLEKIKKFIELRASGHSIRDIAQIVGVSNRSLIKWNRKYCNVIFEVQSEEIKSFKNKILQEKLSRLEYLNSKFSDVKQKLDESELMLRHDKLLLLLMKISKSIDECEKQIVLTQISDKIDDLDKNDILNEIKKEENLENLKENV